MKTVLSLFTSLVLISLLLISCDSPPAPPTAPEEKEPLAFSAPQPEFTVTVTEAELASPRKELKGELNGVDITIDYGSPSTKGRAIWGSLVPYGEVWRTGANEATRITFDESILVGEDILAAGTYSLFTIPAEKEWQVIFNKVVDQWGAYEYDAAQDALRVPVKPVGVDSSSATLEFRLAPGKIVMQWDKLVLPIFLTEA
ncbi:DUF2911 domain-containing protein [Lewinella cohaerens]|uniref:DUF2911 domain-containing protein n=1 Tax=Lewinella cohaerens TaxID=70995 RepID=UPI0003829C5E|nr:DUF2911 domain-containing protein [Lewinella cohaerens]